MVDKELLEQFEILANGMAQMEDRLNKKIEDEVGGVEDRLNRKIEATVEQIAKEIGDVAEHLDKKIDAVQKDVRRVEIIIENDVNKKISSLFDGYKLNHEKQWELERRVEKLEHTVEDVQVKLA